MEGLMSFREKGAWVQIVAILLVYGFYGAQLLGSTPTPMGAIVMLIGSTILMILISIAGHTAIAMFSRPEGVDERDQLVALRGTRNGFHALAAGVWCVIFLAIASPRPVLLAYAALGAFVLAELVRLVSQVVYYRTGA
jgi:hypothetical protein